MRGLGLLALALGLSCSGAGAPAGQGPSPAGGGEDGPVHGIDVVSFEIRPDAPPAERYGAPVLHREGPVEREIQRRLSDLSSTREPALSRMTRMLAHAAPDRFNIPPALVDRLMAWNGLPDPPPHLTIVELSEDGSECATRLSPRCEGAIASLVEQVMATASDKEGIRHGVGVAAGPGGAVRMIVAVLEPGARLKAVPVSVKRGQRVKIAGRLLGKRSSPSVELVDPSGRWRALPTLSGDDRTFEAGFSCTDVGKHQVEVLAEGEHGPEVTANFPVYCGTTPPEVLTVELERVGAGVTDADIARKNFEYLNTERASRGLEPLKWDRQAAKIARTHSEDMVRTGFVGHRSPTTGDVSDRFARAKLKGSIIRENVARGYGPKQIHESLMGSPGHRVNMLAADVTHVGVGVVVDRPETDAEGAPRPIYVTQNFFRDPAHGLDNADPEGSLRAGVAKQRRSSGLKAAVHDDALTKVAAAHARAIARGKKPSLDDAINKTLGARGFGSVDRLHVETNDFASLIALDIWKQKKLTVGVGIAQRRTGSDGVTYVVVILVADASP